MGNKNCFIKIAFIFLTLLFLISESALAEEVVYNFNPSQDKKLLGSLTPDPFTFTQGDSKVITSIESGAVLSPNLLINVWTFSIEVTINGIVTKWPYKDMYQDDSKDNIIFSQQNVRIPVKSGDSISYKIFTKTGGGYIHSSDSQENYVKLTFEDPAIYQLTMAVSPENSGTTTPEIGENQLTEGSINIKAVPLDGYEFDRWEGEGIDNSTASETTVNLDNHKTITAYFKSAVPHKLTMTVSPENSGTTTPEIGESTLTEASVNIKASPSEGYIFDHWQGDGIQDINAPETAVSLNADKIVTAIFTKAFTLTMDVNPDNSGTTTPSTGANILAQGSVSITASSSKDGYLFDYWQGDGIEDIKSSQTNVNLDQDKTITAHFKKAPILTMAVSPENSGTTTPEIGNNTLESGSINITALALDGYVFDHWQGDGIEDTGASETSVSLNANKIITAVFISELPDLADAITGLKILTGMPINLSIEEKNKLDQVDDDIINIKDVIYILQKIAN